MMKKDMALLFVVFAYIIFMVAMFFIPACSFETAEPMPIICKNEYKEFFVSVPFQFEVLDNETTSLKLDGCFLTTLTHYVFDDNEDMGFVGKGNLPIGFFERHCAFDACGPNPINHTGFSINPIRDRALSIRR